MFSNMTIIVAGASSGIGKEIALKLNAEHSKVIAIARSKDKLEQIKSQNAIYSDNFIIEQKDLTEDIENLPKYIDYLKDKYGKFSGLVYSAGIWEINTLQSISVDDFYHLFKINYLVPMFLTKAFANKRNHEANVSSVVYIASIAGVEPEIGQIFYSGSKGALISSAKSISKELSLKKIRCNTISPSWIETDSSLSIAKKYFMKPVTPPLGKGTVGDVANLALFLLSSKSSWITGQNFIIDGGSKRAFN